MYNFMLAFLICCVSYIIGEMVSNLTKMPGFRLFL